MHESHGFKNPGGQNTSIILRIVVLVQNSIKQGQSSHKVHDQEEAGGLDEEVDQADESHILFSIGGNGISSFVLKLLQDSSLAEDSIVSLARQGSTIDDLNGKLDGRISVVTPVYSGEGSSINLL